MLRFPVALAFFAGTVMSSCKPDFGVPPGAVAQISLINSDIKFDGLETSHVFTPIVEGFDVLPTLPSWSFLIESSTGEKVMFDLGIPPDFRKSYSPATWQRLESQNWTITAGKHVADVLSENGVDPSEIKSVIWSHYHWDHVGDMRTFPKSTELVVGPGFQKAYLPAWPTNPTSPLREDYFTGRTLRELNFTKESTIFAGVQRAIDFFGDGSFFLISTPGHTLDHIGGLVRTTTNPDTFIFLGGDLLHHGAELRPSPYLPYPETLSKATFEAISTRVVGCPGHDLGAMIFPNLNVENNRSKTEPLYDPKVADDVGLAIKTIKEVQMADVQDNIFFIWAHDTGIKGLVNEFPEKANDWKAKGWREKLTWAFLEDLVPAALNAAQN